MDHESFPPEAKQVAFDAIQKAANLIQAAHDKMLFDPPDPRWFAKKCLENTGGDPDTVVYAEWIVPGQELSVHLVPKLVVENIDVQCTVTEEGVTFPYKPSPPF